MRPAPVFARELGILSVVLGALALSACKSQLIIDHPSQAKDAVAVEPLVPGSMPWLVQAGGKPGGLPRFVPVPLVAQSRNFTCGVASILSVLSYWGEDFNEGQLQKVLRSDKNNGTSYVDMAKLVRDLNDPRKAEALHATSSADEAPIVFPPDGGVESARADRFSVEVHEGKSTTVRPANQGDEPGVPVDGMTVRELTAAIDAGKPVIMLIQAWTSAEPPKWEDDWDDGHYVVATGYDADRIYFMDPIVKGNYAFLQREELLKRWHDIDVRTEGGVEIKTTLRHFGMVIKGPEADFNIHTVQHID